METTELLEALEVVLTVMGVLIVLILGLLVAEVMLIYQEVKKERGNSRGPSLKKEKTCKKEAS